MTSNYYIQSEIENLSKRIQVLTGKEYQGKKHIGNQQKNWEATRGLSTLLTEVIHQADQLIYFSLEDLFEFHSNYELRNKIKIDLNEIRDRQWIRIISHQVRLPNSITYNLHDFNNKSKNDKLPQIIKDNFEVFKFLFELHQKVGYQEEKKLAIDKGKIDNILKKYKQIFPTLPDLRFFRRTSFIKENEFGSYLINTKHFDFSNDLIENVAAKLWGKMSLENTKIEMVDFDTWHNKTLKLGFHLPNLKELIPSKSFEKLIDFAISKLDNEEDLKNSKYEIDKLWWDHCEMKHFHNAILTIPSKYKIDNSNFLALYESLERIGQRFGVVQYQEIRSDLSFLVQLVVTNDRVIGSSNTFSLTNKLLNSSLDKPFIFKSILDATKRHKPEILPYLLIANNFSAITLTLISKLKINSDIYRNQGRENLHIDRENLLSELYNDAFNIMVRNKDSSLENYQKAINVNFTFKDLLKEIFRTPYSQNYNQDIIVKDSLKKRHKQSLKIFQIDRIDTNYYLPDFIEELIQTINDSKETLPSFPTVSIKLSQYDFLLELLSISKEYKSSLTIQNSITDCILNDLFKIFKKDSIQIHKDFDLKPSTVELEWSSEPYGIENINWEDFIVGCYQTGKLDLFLKCIQKLKIKDDRKWENTQVQRVTFFLKIILISFSRLNSKKDIYHINNIDINDILYSLEKTITSTLAKHSKAEATSNSIDIYSKLKESIYFNRNQPILHYISEALNHFSKKNIESIISTIRNSEAFVSSYFFLYNSLISERDRAFLQKQIESIDIDEFLDKSYWLPTIRSTLIDAINSGVFTKQSETILNYYETVVENRNLNENKESVFYIKLLLAYRKNDEAGIIAVEVPKRQYSVSENKQKYQNYKRFYSALFRVREKNYDEALQILKDLCEKEPDNFEFQLKLLHARSLVALETTKTDYTAASVEFQEIYEGLEKLDEVLNEIRKQNPNTYFNYQFYTLIKLTALCHLKKHSTFEYTYFTSLNSVQRLQQEFLELAVDNFTKDESFLKASKLINQAENYHKLRNDSTPEFVSKLKNKLNNPSNISTLLSSYKSILALQPDDLIRTIPDIINPLSKDLGEFLLWEIVIAANQFLTKIKSIKKNIGEDEFTDFLQIIINSQLKNFNLKIEEQNRSGSSATKKKIGVGNVDLTLPNGFQNVTLEAVRFNSKQGVKNNFDKIIEHIKKTFNYSTTKKYFYNIVYYQGANFDTHWNDFLNTKLPHVNFPNGYSLLDVKEPSKKVENAAIKTVKSLHENDLEFYHIFLNLNYLA